MKIQQQTEENKQTNSSRSRSRSKIHDANDYYYYYFNLSNNVAEKLLLFFLHFISFTFLILLFLDSWLLVLLDSSWFLILSTKLICTRIFSFFFLLFLFLLFLFLFHLLSSSWLNKVNPKWLFVIYKKNFTRIYSFFGEQLTSSSLRSPVQEYSFLGENNLIKKKMN